MCDAGVGLTPEVDGRRLHVSAGGLSNGLVLLRDDETGSFWNSFTGEALAGPMLGKTMATFSVHRVRAGEARATRPDLELLRSPISTYGRMWSRSVSGITRDEEGYMPPFFRKSFDAQDTRRGELELGLGVVVDGRARFYPGSELAKAGGPVVDAIAGRGVVIDRDEQGLGRASPLGEQPAPFFVWGRWYGFSHSFPGCDVWSAPAFAAAPPPVDDADRFVALLRAPCTDR